MLSCLFTYICFEVYNGHAVLFSPKCAIRANLQSLCATSNFGSNDLIFYHGSFYVEDNTKMKKRFKKTEIDFFSEHPIVGDMVGSTKVVGKVRLALAIITP